jgi:hypothetical protein
MSRADYVRLLACSIVVLFGAYLAFALAWR